MEDFLPPQATVSERAVLLVYHVLGIKDAKEIMKILRYKHRSEVYRTLKKFRGVPVHFNGGDHQYGGSSYIAPVGLK